MYKIKKFLYYDIPNFAVNKIKYCNRSNLYLNPYFLIILFLGLLFSPNIIKCEPNYFYDILMIILPIYIMFCIFYQNIEKIMSLNNLISFYLILFIIGLINLLIVFVPNIIIRKMSIHVSNFISKYSLTIFNNLEIAISKLFIFLILFIIILFILCLFLDYEKLKIKSARMTIITSTLFFTINYIISLFPNNYNFVKLSVENSQELNLMGYSINQLLTISINGILLFINIIYLIMYLFLSYKEEFLLENNLQDPIKDYLNSNKKEDI
ncbi:hypothetical protein [Anaerofustis stercorihominis]|uniref:hypothetical protein n=1 Tax=Anaerofustis stercorihominis TaxID=214853 RepID=UPI00214D0A32|nr:hypothetical protein [Anaerofustis stercorihominis]MCR2032889.1 hypothetical protein [Anaerofustis stercorihominis]